MIEFVKRIGIEHEFWLLCDKEIVEPAIFNFPHDEFGFLFELRTEPHILPELLLKDYLTKLKFWTEKIKPMGLTLSNDPDRFLGKELIEKLSQKYNYAKLKDLTANIYPNSMGSHATGINGVFGTAGIHVHFSCHLRSKRVQLPTVEIVSEMDRVFFDYVVNTGRILGEYENKVHGFEYRSLPSSVPIVDVIRKAFSILEKTT